MISWLAAATSQGLQRHPLVDSDLIGPSEGFRTGFSQMTGFPDYFAVSHDARTHLDKLASTDPKTLALMHGGAWRGAAGEAAQMQDPGRPRDCLPALDTLRATNAAGRAGLRRGSWR